MIGGRSADDCPRVWHADANQIGAMTPTSSIDAQRVRITKAYRLIGYWRSNSSAARTMGTGE